MSSRLTHPANICASCSSLRGKKTRRSWTSRSTPSSPACVKRDHACSGCAIRPGRSTAWYVSSPAIPRARLIVQPQRPVIPYYVFPPLFPYLAPILVGMSALLFAVLGRGQYADQWRSWIIRTFGKGMIPGATWFMIVMVCAMRSAMMRRADVYSMSVRQHTWLGRPRSTRCHSAKPYVRDTLYSRGHADIPSGQVGAHHCRVRVGVRDRVLGVRYVLLLVPSTVSLTMTSAARAHTRHLPRDRRRRDSLSRAGIRCHRLCGKEAAMISHRYRCMHKARYHPGCE